MLNVKFPRYCSVCDFHRYYNIHYRYFLGILLGAKCNVKIIDHKNFENYSKTAFEIFINDNLIAIDFSDHLKLSIPDSKVPKYKAIFKFHYEPSLHGSYENIYPFSPVNFQNWTLYYDLLSKIEYKAEGLVTCKQKPGGAAVERREMVQKMLRERYKVQFDKTILQERSFYLSINKTLVAVCAPGARNDMLDRGQAQYMAFGTCTISPKLLTLLSYGKELIPGTHYIECKPDYSDLIEKIEWVRENKDEAVQIGKNAKELFNETGLPIKQIEWIKKCLSII
jgi:hypothetical protein